jgi:hypothetical protein
MDWILKLIEKHTKDGVLDFEALNKEMAIEFPKYAVPKATFNDINEQLKTANTTITELKKNNEDNETLQATIKTHETTIATLKVEADKTRKEYVLKEKLNGLGVTDADYLIFKQGGIDKFNFDGDGNPIGLEETIKPYQESVPHIFKQEQQQPKFTGVNPVDGTKPLPGHNPWKKENFNLTDQGKIFKENPELAKSLMSQAGVTQ